MALTTAEKIGGVPGSPMPPGGSVLGTMWTSISGISFIPQHIVIVKVGLDDPAPVNEYLALQECGQTVNDAAFDLRLDCVGG